MHRKTITEDRELKVSPQPLKNNGGENNPVVLELVYRSVLNTEALVDWAFESPQRDQIKGTMNNIVLFFLSKNNWIYKY